MYNFWITALHRKEQALLFFTTQVQWVVWRQDVAQPYWTQIQKLTEDVRQRKLVADNIEMPYRPQEHWITCIYEKGISICLIWTTVYLEFCYSLLYFVQSVHLLNPYIGRFSLFNIFFIFTTSIWPFSNISAFLCHLISYNNWFLSCFIQFKATYFIVSVSGKDWSEKQNHKVRA